MPAFIGTSITFSRPFRWPLDIQRIWKCESRFRAGYFPNYIFYQFIAAGILGTMQGVLGIAAWRW
jgi:hypothetical protein